jgi:hypothetical protein
MHRIEAEVAMEMTDIIVLIFIVGCFAAFMATLAWASRPPRRAGKPLPQSATSPLVRHTGNYSVSR